MKKRVWLAVYAIVISIGLTACGHKHTFKEATCTEPRTCTECGETEGEALGHTWKDADCENPKTCTICGQTEGEALGHTVDVGLCSRCNKIVNEELINEVMDYLKKASDESNNALSEVKMTDIYSVSDAYTHALTAERYFNKAKVNLQKIYELCGDYDGLSSIKIATKAVLDVMPSKITGFDSSSEVKWLTECKDFARALSSFYSTAANYANDLAQSPE